MKKNKFLIFCLLATLCFTSCTKKDSTVKSENTKIESYALDTDNATSM